MPAYQLQIMPLATHFCQDNFAEYWRCRIFAEFKGALTEQFVMQELTSMPDMDYIAYWTNDRSTAEVDFIIQRQGEIVPVEVKSGESLRSRSFTPFCQTYAPKLAVKTSMLPYQADTPVVNVPLYGLKAFFGR